MKGTLISILVGALAGVLLTIGSNVHAAHVAAARAKHASSDVVAPAQVAADAAHDAAVPPAPPSEQTPLQK